MIAITTNSSTNVNARVERMDLADMNSTPFIRFGAKKSRPLDADIALTPDAATWRMPIVHYSQGTPSKHSASRAPQPNSTPRDSSHKSRRHYLNAARSREPQPFLAMSLALKKRHGTTPLAAF
jgi:hypothetical protein